MSLQDLLETLREPEQWRLEAACRGLPSGSMFPNMGHSWTSENARAVCATCAVTEECLDAAVATDEHYGCWGGYCGRELRKAIVARRRELRRIEMAS